MKKRKLLFITGILTLILMGTLFVTTVLAGSSEASDCQQAIRLLGDYDEGSYWDNDTKTCMLRYEYPEFSNTCFPAFDQSSVVYGLGDEDPVTSLQFVGCSE